MNLGRDPGTGKQLRRSIYGKTQAEVRKKLNELTKERDDGVYAKPTSMTVSVWLDVWQNEYLLSIRASTKDLYSQQIRLYIVPALGAVKLNKLNSTQIQKMYRELSERLSPKSVKNVHGVLHKALEQAVSCGYIKINT